MISKSAVCAMVASIALLGAGGARSEPWRTYHNDRFGTSAQYPATWTAYPPPANGDGLIFHSQDEHATITISGMYATDSLASELALRSKPANGERITYLKQGPSSIVVSGIKGETIFYRKSLISCGIARDLSIEYPINEKSNYDSLVTHVAASLNPTVGKCR